MASFKMSDISLKTHVDFLCIGAQRSGTSWLFRNLQAHPDIWIPPCKEVHYFSRSSRYHSPSHLECQGFFEKLLGRDQRARTWRWLFFGYAGRWLAKAGWPQKPARLVWIWSYFFREPGDEWYLRLFWEGKEKICGEITPDYSLLEEKDVEHVASLLPDVKILFLMRNPLDRVLSQLRYHMDGRALPCLGKASPHELVKFAVEEGQMARGDYPRILDTWSRYFPSKNIHCVFYEDICERPRKVLEEILSFIGANPECFPDAGEVATRRNASMERTLDIGTLRQIAEAHESVVRECARCFGGYAEDWFKRLTSMKFADS